MTKFRTLTFALIAAAMASSAAQARPFTPAMSCGSAANTVSLNGAIVMSTGRHTYDRFVISKAYCTPQETLKPAYVETANDDQCFVGYTCEQIYGKGRR
ncbi:MAG: hypothetical protein AB7F96_19745 [Beijerinckiaceae bacterium]